jgi:hypothetical protein
MAILQRFAAVAMLLLSSPVWAESAHYLVFELDALGRAWPQFYRLVELDGSIAVIDPDSRLAPKRLPDGGSALNALAWGPQGLLAAHRIELADTLRAEAVDAAGQLRRVDVRAASSSFVVRVPAAASRLSLQTTEGAQEFDLAALAADADHLPLAGFAPPQVLAKQAKAGPESNRVDLLVMGDGFTAAEQAAFDAQAAAVEGEFLAVTPYKEYAELVNLTRLFTASAQSGADHPPYQAGCSSANCCADTAAQTDPRRGVFVDTAFDATFCAFQVHRLLTISTSKVLAAAAAAPNWDKAIVLVNDPVYGGSGGIVPVASAHAAAVMILIHEYGHSFHDLADEYTSPFPGFPACSDLGGSAPCEANVTNQTDPAQVKWRFWFTPDIPIPTPPGTPGVGLFQGARYLVSGMYRPADTCLMGSLVAPGFCPVCAQEYVLKLYRGGFGVPAGGIDLIEPGTEVPSSGAPVAYQTGAVLTFTADVLLPGLSGIERQWYLDGVPIAGATGASFAFSQSTTTPSTRNLELRVTDRSEFLSPEMAGALAEHVRSWVIQVSEGADPDQIFGDGFEN